MMKLINKAEQLELQADRYRLIFAQDRPFVNLEDENGISGWPCSFQHPSAQGPG